MTDFGSTALCTVKNSFCRSARNFLPFPWIPMVLVSQQSARWWWWRWWWHWRLIVANGYGQWLLIRVDNHDLWWFTMVFDASWLLREPWGNILGKQLGYASCDQRIGCLDDHPDSDECKRLQLVLPRKLPLYFDDVRLDIMNRYWLGVVNKWLVVLYDDSNDSHDNGCLTCASVLGK